MALSMARIIFWSSGSALTLFNGRNTRKVRITLTEGAMGKMRGIHAVTTTTKSSMFHESCK